MMATHFNKENFLSLDLELNQPSGEIIQIGAVVGNLKTGEILEEFNEYIKIDEPLNAFIIQLTAISEQTLQEKGTTLIEAFQKLKDLHTKYNCFTNAITWGGGDSQELFQQLQRECEIGKPFQWPFGRRWIDIKTIFQMYQFSRGEKLQSGLAKSMIKLGLKFTGQKHNALDDAKNTFILARHLLKLFK